MNELNVASSPFSFFRPQPAKVRSAEDGPVDCLLIGHNDSNFEEYVRMVRSMDAGSGAYRDLNLAFVEHEGKPYRALDIYSHFRRDEGGPHRHFHNTDFLWPAIVTLGNFIARRGFSFDYINSYQMEKDKLGAKLRGDHVLLVAITTTLYISPHPILEIVGDIRRHNPSVKIVIGGPYISNQEATSSEAELFRLFDYLGADYYVISHEGETALGNLLGALRHGGSLDAVHNLAYRKDGRFVRTAVSREENPLEENPVDLSIFPDAGIGEFLTLRTAKSCPFSCAFCGFPKRAGAYRYEGIEHVERTLNTLRESGSCTTITFLDDTFNVPKNRFREILAMMIRNQYGFRWNSFYRSDHGDTETIAMMKEAGCEGVFLGVESGSDFIMERMNKTSRRKHYLKAIPDFRSVGITTYASLIVGFPGETYDTFAETRDLIETAQPDFFRSQLWYCDPMTAVWERREELGIEGAGFSWRHKTMDYQTACELIDRLFLSVENSVWLPQWGFELWSTFYLQRNGMSLAQVKTFVRSFNNVIRERLLYQDIRPQRVDAIRALEASCNGEFGASTVALSGLGSTYAAAEAFWIEEARHYAEPVFSSAADCSSKPLDRTVDVQTIVAWQSAIASRFPNQSLESVLLAAFGAVCGNIFAMDELACVTGCAAPVRIACASGSSFIDNVELTASRLRAMQPWSEYAAYFLASPARLRLFGIDAVRLELGCYPRDMAEKVERVASMGLSLALEMPSHGSQNFGLRLRYREGIADNLAAEIAEAIGAALETLIFTGDVCLSTKRDVSRLAMSGALVEQDADEIFRF